MTSARVRRIGVILVVAVVVTAIGGPILRDYVILHINGWMAPRVGAPRPVVWAAGPATAAEPAAKRPPNIVLILADDLGYNDLTVSGGGVAGGAVPTPNIDSIAHQGVNLTRGYSGNATCAPSRCACSTLTLARSCS